MSLIFSSCFLSFPVKTTALTAVVLYGLRNKDSLLFVLIVYNDQSIYFTHVLLLGLNKGWKGEICFCSIELRTYYVPGGFYSPLTRCGVWVISSFLWMKNDDVQNGEHPVELRGRLGT